MYNFFFLWGFRLVRSVKKDFKRKNLIVIYVIKEKYRLLSYGELLKGFELSG